MDYSNYKEKKKNGLVSIEKINDAYALITKQFNSQTGQQIESNIEAFDVDVLQNDKAMLQLQIDNINSILLDLQ